MKPICLKDTFFLVNNGSKYLSSIPPLLPLKKKKRISWTVTWGLSGAFYCKTEGKGGKKKIKAPITGFEDTAGILQSFLQSNTSNYILITLLYSATWLWIAQNYIWVEHSIAANHSTIQGSFPISLNTVPCWTASICKDLSLENKPGCSGLFLLRYSATGPKQVCDEDLEADQVTFLFIKNSLGKHEFWFGWWRREGPLLTLSVFSRGTFRWLGWNPLLTDLLQSGNCCYLHGVSGHLHQWPQSTRQPKAADKLLWKLLRVNSFPA